MSPRAIPGLLIPTTCPRCGGASELIERGLVADLQWTILRTALSAGDDRPDDLQAWKDIARVVVVLSSSSCARMIGLCEQCTAWLADEVKKGDAGVPHLPGQGHA